MNRGSVCFQAIFVKRWTGIVRSLVCSKSDLQYLPPSEKCEAGSHFFFPLFGLKLTKTRWFKFIVYNMRSDGQLCNNHQTFRCGETYTGSSLLQRKSDYDCGYHARSKRRINGLTKLPSLFGHFRLKDIHQERTK